MEMDVIRREHFDFNYKTAESALEIVKDVIDSMSKGQLSTRIAEIHNMPKAYDNFIEEATKNGYIAAANSHNHLYQMPTTYKIDNDSMILHLFVHIPLVRDTEVMRMFQYKPSQIPVSNKYGINVKDKHDDV